MKAGKCESEGCGFESCKGYFLVEKRFTKKFKFHCGMIFPVKIITLRFVQNSLNASARQSIEILTSDYFFNISQKDTIFNLLLCKRSFSSTV